jgi:tetratricopeptide (TPR) repeat protein
VKGSTSSALPSRIGKLALAREHFESGRIEYAERICREISPGDPEFAGALHLRGLVARRRGRTDEAALLIQQAIGVGAAPAHLHFTLGDLLHELGRREEALECFRRGFERNPGHPQAHNNLGNLLKSLGRLDDAVRSYRRALALKPEYMLAHYNLANSLKLQGHLEEAVASFQRALAIDPAYAPTLNNLGNTLVALGRLEEAVEFFRRALDVQPHLADAHNNLAGALAELGHFDEAVACFEQAITLDPGFPDAHYNLGLALLRLGRYESGWNEYEWRWKCRAFPTPPRRYRQPQWAGEDIAGKTILLYLEQGNGDGIQFVRYVPLVAARGARVLLETRRLVARLFEPFTQWAELVEADGRLPPFDLHCPLLSLPRAFRTTSDSIPRAVPYLTPDPKLTDAWQARIPPTPGKLRVGLVWGGNLKQASESKRGVGIEPCLPLFQTPGTIWFSLQVGPQAPDICKAPAGAITDLSDGLDDFADTAAAITNLDLVITSDTAVAHLAGAMNRPVWVMLRYCPDWRWLLERTDSPWYPGMRLFRQPRRGDWNAVVAEVQAALSELVRTGSTIDENRIHRPA